MDPDPIWKNFRIRIQMQCIWIHNIDQNDPGVICFISNCRQKPFSEHYNKAGNVVVLVEALHQPVHVCHCRIDFPHDVLPILQTQLTAEPDHEHK